MREAGVREGVRDERRGLRVAAVAAGVAAVAAVVETCRLMERVTVCEADWSSFFAKWRGSLSEAILMWFTFFKKN